MRAFIAIPLPKEIKEQLSLIQEQLKRAKADVKWVAPENIHLTLKFLGEIDQEQADKISSSIIETAVAFPRFKARISALGAFPRISSVRVVWLGIEQGDAQVKEIAASLEEKLALLGLPKEERPFSSHITLGRTKSGLNLERLAKLLQEEGILKEEQKKEFIIDRIILFQSRLSACGPTYEPLKEASLKTA